MLKLTNLLTTVATAPDLGDDERDELVWSRDQLATRMPAVEVLVLAGLLSATPGRRPLPIAS